MYHSIMIDGIHKISIEKIVKELFSEMLTDKQIKSHKINFKVLAFDVPCTYIIINFKSFISKIDKLVYKIERTLFDSGYHILSYPVYVDYANCGSDSKTKK